MKNKFEINKENRAEMTGLLQEYFYKERDEELGGLAASILLDFIAEELGPYFYNQGVHDAQRFMEEKVEDMLGLQK